MLGYVTPSGEDKNARILPQVAALLSRRGLHLAGTVPRRTETNAGAHPQMDLEILGVDRVVRISQDLGPFAQGCRLDPGALAEAVQLVEARLDRGGISLLIINKFGKQEAEGGGFRHVFGKALIAGLPVLTSVSAGQLGDFLEFADPMATLLPSDPDAVLSWCLGAWGGLAA